jgi:phosphatidylethanolamine-binding protein (PEBP) family uncharacterized protein
MVNGMDPTLALTTPAVGRGDAIATRYTCHGQNESPPLSWGALPPRTAEVIVFVLGLPHTLSGKGRSSVEWALAGLPPSSHGIEAGKLPADAVVGRDDSGHVGYSLCPRGVRAQRYVVLAYALPKSLGLSAGFPGHPAFTTISRMKPVPSFGALLANYISAPSASGSHTRPA